MDRQGHRLTAVRLPRPSAPVRATAAGAAGWRPAVALIAAAVVVFGIVFRADVAAALRVWTASTAYNHSFLILPMIGFLLWQRRQTFLEAAPRAALWPLLLMPALSAFWLAAAFLDLHEGRELAVVAMFEIVLVTVLGPRLYRHLLGPLLMLFFLVPSGAFLVPALQRVTAEIAVAGLHLMRVPVYSDGIVIEIPEGTFDIAEACAGLRFLIASVVFGCFFALVMYRSLWRRVLFIMLSLVVPIGANGVRAFGIIWLAHLEGSATAVAADHVIYGWLFFSLVIVLLIALGAALAETSGAAPGASRLRPIDGGAGRRLVIAGPAAILLALAGPGYAAWLDGRPAPAGLAAVAPPSVAPPWRRLPAADPAWRPHIHGADRTFLEGFAAPGAGRVLCYVALYRLQAIGNPLTNSENRIADGRHWAIARRGRTRFTWGGKPTAVDAAEIVSGPRRRLVWSFYVVDGRVADRLLEAKLLQARASLFGGAPIAAFVAVSAEIGDPGEPAAARLARFLNAVEPPARYLENLRRSSAAPVL